MFEPWTFARSGLTASNRLVVAAMTNKQSNPDGSLHARELRWLTRRAAGGFGMVATCAAHVRLDGQGWPGELGVYDDVLMPGLRELAGGLSSHGALGVVQLFHGGLRAPSDLTGQQPISAAAFTPAREGAESSRPATEDEILAIIASFAAAAARCEAAGFQGVELHGAHGYLLSQFLGQTLNTRTDDWGGPSLENRARLLMTTLRAVRERVSAGFLVGVRISPELTDIGVELDDSLQVAAWLAEGGADFVHVSLWDAWKRTKRYPDDPTPLTTRFRQALPDACPLMIAGGIWSRAQAEAVCEQGADFIALARAAIAHPDWPRAARADPNYAPAHPPFTPEALEAAALSPRFVDYMRRWPGFVTDGRPPRAV
ncbi:MAG: NADH:flavin oxidoreductase [Myxococcota bacterium]